MHITYNRTDGEASADSPFVACKCYLTGSDRLFLSLPQNGPDTRQEEDASLGKFLVVQEQPVWVKQSYYCIRSLYLSLLDHYTNLSVVQC